MVTKMPSSRFVFVKLECSHTVFTMLGNQTHLLNSLSDGDGAF